MLNFLVTLLSIILLSLSTFAADETVYSMQIGKSLRVINSDDDSHVMHLSPGQYVHPRYQENLDKWYMELQISDSNNNLVSTDVFRVGQQTFNRAVSEPIAQSLAVQDKFGNQHQVAPGSRFVVMNSPVKSWYHETYIVDDEGEILDHKGMPVATTNRGDYIYKVSKQTFDQAQLQTRQDNLNNLLYKVNEEEPKACPKKTQNAEAKGCEVLETSMVQSDYTTGELSACLSSIKKKILDKAIVGGKLNRKKAFKAMYTELTPAEQDFAAKVFTVGGEVGAIINPPQEDMIMVMQVMDNRADYYKKRYESKGGKYAKINALDMALQPWQFSMYNPNEPGWKRALVGQNMNNIEKNAIESYVRYNSGAKVEAKGQDITKVRHYVAQWMKVKRREENRKRKARGQKLKEEWWKDKTPSKITVDGKSIKTKGSQRHVFYKGIADAGLNLKFRP